MSKTVVGLFKSTAEAQQVKQALVSNGYDSSDISVMANDYDEGPASSRSMDVEGSRNTGFGSDGEDIGTDAGLRSTARTHAGTGSGEGIGQKIGDFFRSLTGGDEEVHGHYASGVNQGGALLTVKAEDEDANEIANLLRQHGARNIEGDSQSSGAGSPVYGSENRGEAKDRKVAGETAIPVVEEQLQVGKREIDRGGVRVYSHVVERPADANVTLRDERVNVERRTVDRPATAADFEAGKEASFEVRATGEEAVIEKVSRVVEEVTVGKQTNERTEAVHDTVRKTEVEVEQIAENDTAQKNRY